MGSAPGGGGGKRRALFTGTSLFHRAISCLCSTLPALAARTSRSSESRRTSSSPSSSSDPSGSEAACGSAAARRRRGGPRAGKIASSCAGPIR